MTTEQELSAAVERLRRIRGGDEWSKVYPDAGDMIVNYVRAIVHDEKTLADAYLALGTRQPEQFAIKSPLVNRLYEADDLEHAKVILGLVGREAKLVRVTTFIQEVQP